MSYLSRLGHVQIIRPEASERTPTPEPVHDPILAEWYYIDQDGITYYSATPGECYRQAAEGARVEAEHWRHNRHWSDAPEAYRDDEGEIPCQATS